MKKGEGREKKTDIKPEKGNKRETDRETDRQDRQADKQRYRSERDLSCHQNLRMDYNYSKSYLFV